MDNNYVTFKPPSFISITIEDHFPKKKCCIYQRMTAEGRKLKYQDCHQDKLEKASTQNLSLDLTVAEFLSSKVPIN